MQIDHIFIKNLDENNNFLGLDTSELRFGGVQKLVLELKTRPRTEQFKSHFDGQLVANHGPSPTENRHFLKPHLSC